LALRNPTDEDTSAVEPLTRSGILKGKKEQKPEPKVVFREKPVPTPREPEKPDSVIMIKGATKKTEVTAMPEKKEEKKEEKK